MSRTVKEEEHAVKRNEILDVAQRLIYTKGYGQMTIQDILDDLKISKGAFYHYFDSKQTLLDGLIDHMMEEAVVVLNPIVQDPTLPAIEKLQRYFVTAGRWKTGQKTFLIALLRVWYNDHNALVRQKQTSTLIKHIAPLIAGILRQGVEEDVFTTAYPDQASQILLSLFVSLGDVWAEVLLAEEPLPDAQQVIECAIAAYTDALERLLGAPSGSLHLVDNEMLRAWLVP